MDQTRIEICQICKNEFDKLDLDECENCNNKACCFCSLDGVFCREECRLEYNESEYMAQCDDEE